MSSITVKKTAVAYFTVNITFVFNYMNNSRETRWVTCVLQCDIVERSRNHCIVCVAKLYVAVNYVKTLSAAQQRYYGKFMSPVKIKHMRVLMSST